MNSPEFGGVFARGLGSTAPRPHIQLDQGTDLECEPNFFDADGFVPWDERMDAFRTWDGCEFGMMLGAFFGK